MEILLYSYSQAALRSKLGLNNTTGLCQMTPKKLLMVENEVEPGSLGYVCNPMIIFRFQRL